MAIDKDAYQELENVVGPENISQDPAVLDSYSCHATLGGVPLQGAGLDVWWPRAGAVLLPGSTEEVTQIIKICNYYKIKFRAHSTGQIPTAFSQSEKGITLDLRRMNRIIEINQEHMYALVEPYVTQGELMVETIKKGLIPHLIDAGASSSPLASVTSVFGEGDSAITRGFSERNALAVEWVLPHGEIVRLGSPDTPNCDWFSGDGPGPSLLGMMRGGLGAGGERGVFTKAAIKLYPWYGPKSFETGGAAPWFEIKDWPLHEALIIKWNDYDDEANGLYLIGEADIFDTFGRISGTKLEAMIAESKEEWAIIRRSGVIGKLFPKGGWSAHISAKSQEQFDYCHKAIEKIMKETNGEILHVEDLPVPEGVNHPERFHWRVKQAIMGLGIFRDYTAKACFMPMSGTIGPFPAATYFSIDSTMKLIKETSIPIKEKYQKMGQLLDDGPDGCWCIIEEGGHHMHYMNFTRIEPEDPKADRLGIMVESMAKATQLGFGFGAVMPSLDKMAISNYLEKLQKVLDPEELASGGIGFHNITNIFSKKIDD
jgi:glycolate oxidase